MACFLIVIVTLQGCLKGYFKIITVKPFACKHPQVFASILFGEAVCGYAAEAAEGIQNWMSHLGEPLSSPYQISLIAVLSWRASAKYLAPLAVIWFWISLKKEKYFALDKLLCLRLVCSILPVTHLAWAWCVWGGKSTLLLLNKAGVVPGTGGFWFPSAWLACLASDNPPIEVRPRGSKPLQSKVHGRLSGLLSLIVQLTTQLLSDHSRAAVEGIIHAGSKLLLWKAIHWLL